MAVKTERGGESAQEGSPEFSCAWQQDNARLWVSPEGAELAQVYLTGQGLK